MSLHVFGIETRFNLLEVRANAEELLFLNLDRPFFCESVAEAEENVEHRASSVEHNHLQTSNIDL
jgi:hypothetical protein